MDACAKCTMRRGMQRKSLRRGKEPLALTLQRTLSDLCRDTCNHCSRRHVGEDHGVGADDREVSNLDVAENNSSNADVHSAPEHWRPGQLIDPADAERAILPDDA